MFPKLLIFVFVSPLLADVFVAESSGNCPNGAIEGTKYRACYFVEPAPATFPDAKSACQDKVSTLLQGQFIHDPIVWQTGINETFLNSPVCKLIEFSDGLPIRKCADDELHPFICYQPFWQKN
uniref:C-type lectin domain-containing protein n=1 Tax=Panagrolaimus sp. JU765 TaxID=591449 RepID=A0AC34RTB0_9BILA